MRQQQRRGPRSDRRTRAGRCLLNRAALDAWLAAGDELHAPAVLPYELANVLARRVFNGALTTDDVADIWSDLSALAVVLHLFDLERDGLEVAAVTARLRRRHATDSTYIWLAQRPPLSDRQCLRRPARRTRV